MFHMIRAVPAWAVMWTLAVAIYAGCKWLSWRRASVSGASPGMTLGYLLIWPGLDANTFLGRGRDVKRPERNEWIAALTKTAIGLIVLFVITARIPMNQPWVAGWVGMVGIVMSLHFGSFHLLSCIWRQA